MNSQQSQRQFAHTIPTTQIELRLRLPILSFFIVLAAALLFPNRAWNTLLVGLGGMFLAAYLWAQSMARGLSAHRQLQSRWVEVGDRLEELFEITNYSSLPALWVEVQDETSVPGYRTAVVRSVSPNSYDRWRERAICQQRGQYTLGPWAIRTGDPFGIFIVTHRYDETSEIIIHPPIHDQLPVDLPAGQSSGRHRARQRSWQATNNAATVRKYQPGDPLRWIHWPTSARHADLYSREFDLDAAGDLWILVDMQEGVQLGSGLDGTEEHAVLLAASLAVRALRYNRAVGLACYGRIPQLIPAARGASQRWRILRALAITQTDGQISLRRSLQDLAATAERGSAALIITPSGTTDWLPELLHLAQRGIEGTVVILDRPSFGGTGHSQTVVNGVRQLGLAGFVLHQGETGVPLYAHRHHIGDFIVTGTGKVVMITETNE
jgi:uncharacterized protein (DUF58 family)